MKVTVCELPGDRSLFENAWQNLVKHVYEHESELVLLPEMPFHDWLAHTRDFDQGKWQDAVSAHQRWIERIGELGAGIVAASRPEIVNSKNQNIGFIWEKNSGIRYVHTKYYLPDDEGFWEATWYERGDGTFKAVNTPKGKLGFLICTDMWFPQKAREYGQNGVQILLVPRSTPRGTTDKWLACARTDAVVSGAFCLSSNWGGTSSEGGQFAGKGWIIEPEVGTVLAVTSASEPFLTLNIDLEKADAAKSTYPRYVRD